MTSKLALPPERETIEKEVAELFQNGDLSNIARLLQKDYSQVSRSFNPFEETRPNPVYQIIIHLWAFDALRDGLAGEVLNIILRERDKWSQHGAVPNTPELTGKVGQQFIEAVQTELEGMPHNIQINEWRDVCRAAQEKMQAVMDERNAKHFRTNVANIR